MATQDTSGHSSPVGNEDDSAAISGSQTQDDGDAGIRLDAGMDESPPPGSPSAKHALPLQKRRRVTRACDECRRKKIKCDGKQPCTHCTVYSYECTYDQPSNRRRNPAPQYIEALEARLHKAEALLRAVMPEVNIDDPRFDAHSADQILAAARQGKHKTVLPNKAAESNVQPAPDGGDESLLESMMDNTGSLDLDDQGHWDYHGHSSSVTFLQRLRKQFGNMIIADVRPLTKARPISHILESPKSASESPMDSNLPLTHDLPPKEAARKLCSNALDDACAIMRFMHRPTFYAMFDRIYDIPPEQFTNEENSFLPLLYVVLSVGCLFASVDDSTLDITGYENAIGQGFQYFKAGRQMLDVTDVRDLTSLQALCFMILFLQSSARLSTCYSYVGIAMRAALRLGLHRSVPGKFNPIEQESRKRTFWVVRKMDVYVCTMLGLPQMLSDDDIDQEFPLEVDDEFITATGILPMPPKRTSMMASANAHSRLANILLKVVKHIYPVKPAKHGPGSDRTYMVSHSKIREIERDLQAWMEALPTGLRPGDEVSPEMERMRQLLRISYAHVQIMMYRPFLHYVAGGCQARGIDKRSYACAAACVSVARNVVHITAGMKKRRLLNGSYWFTMYTTHFAILSLIFFVLENPDSPTAKDGILKDALEGKNTLTGLAKKSMAADRCTQSLDCLFKHLPEKLRNRQSSGAAQTNKKRTQASITPDKGNPVQPPAGTSKAEPLPLIAPQRASTFPTHLASSASTQPAEGAKYPIQAPVSLDDSQMYSRTQPAQSWPTGEPTPPQSEATTSMPSTTSDEHVEQSPPSLPSSQQPAVSFSQPFDQSNQFPDLMPMMFPSGDPFAYPNQPMSTLEDQQFKNDQPGATPFSFGPSLVSPQATSAPPFGAFQNPAFAAGHSATLPPHLRHLNQSTRTSSPQSPLTSGVQSPDLVSMPDQSPFWQSVDTMPQTPAQPQPQAQAQAPGTRQQFPNANMGMHGFGGFGSLGLGSEMGMNMNLDDIFGDISGTGTEGTGDDWTQWMDVGV